MNSARLTIHPPDQPVMLFDGECHFCRRWVERWREQTGDAVEYVASQEAGDRFPEIRPEEFQRSVFLVEPDGTITSGARAVFTALRYGRGPKWPLKVYEAVPGCAAISEIAYRVVASHRAAASGATRLLWGGDVRRAQYFIARSLFLRALGIVYLLAIVSLWIQITGLIGAHGISPVTEFLDYARSAAGDRATFLLPTLLWLNASDAALHVVCGIAAAAALLLIAGRLPAAALAVLFVCYLSLTVGGQVFLSFQWDILLLEAGFLAIFFAPWSRTFGRARPLPVSRVGLFLLKFLLFKLMFMSGVVKLTSGDPSWWDLTALTYHYETQPLPAVPGWWAHAAPLWFQKASTAFVLVVELAVPFLLFGPRRVRLVGAALLVVLQLLIALTGNYAFFNLLTIILCILLVDDRTWGTLPFRSRGARANGNGPAYRDAKISWQTAGAVLALLVTLPINMALLYTAFRPLAPWPRPVAALGERIEPLRIANGYGLFRVMTRTRPEIILEGSIDGIDWKPYEFRWKPGDVNKPPRRAAPHQPRLDWQMWFAALGSIRDNAWIAGLAERLLEGRPEVLALLETDPFPERPPRYLRAMLYRYRFTSPAERRATGHWWSRTLLREYFSTVTLDDLQQ